MAFGGVGYGNKQKESGKSMINDELLSEDNESTYCPEDNKLRLYVGRVPRPEYDALRSEGWKSTQKQDCDFVAVWSPDREDTATSYAGDIGDEDQSPADRAADRAERFAGYREKRLNEATGHADKYDSGPMLHGHQSEALAVRRAARHDLQGTRAVNQWDKASYWQYRTSGVIGHALHVSTPGVRMGRIKILEADLRKSEKSGKDYKKRFEMWGKVSEQETPEKAFKLAYALSNSGDEWGKYHHPRKESESDYVKENGTSLYSLLTHEPDPITGLEAAALWLGFNGEPIEGGGRWSNHRRLRLAYENQMLESQGGRAAHIEMIPGGFIGSKQITKVNKSNLTGRVVSVVVVAEHTTYKDGNLVSVTGPVLLNIERLGADIYRAPSEDELAVFEAEKKAAKKAQAKKPKGPSLINPTPEDAARLQTVWNDRARAKHDAQPGAKYAKDFEPMEVLEMVQKAYSAYSKGSYSRVETRQLCASGKMISRNSNMWSSHQQKSDAEAGAVLCKLRVTGYSETMRVILITDKKQKPFPSGVFDAGKPIEDDGEAIRAARASGLGSAGPMTGDDAREVMAAGHNPNGCDVWQDSTVQGEMVLA